MTESLARLREDASSFKPRALALELTKGCNLRCGYCYYADREDAYQPQSKMSPDVAEQALDLLLKESAPTETPHVHLFGGEPLLNFPLVRHVVCEGERRARSAGRGMTFELTTNGTRFTDEIIEFLNAHRVRVGVSFDGPREIQDAARPAPSGSSYDAALPGIRRFLASRKNSPLEDLTHASAVVTRRDLDVSRIVRHLEEVGFVRVILSPATDLQGNEEGLRSQDLPELLRAYDTLAREHEQRLRVGRRPIDTWFEGLLKELLSGKRKTAFCEGGRDYLGITADGRAWLCYRFYEMDGFQMGSVQEGIDRGVTERLIDLPIDQREACRRCWARHFCGGGCHHENLVTTGGLGEPNPVTCEILRHGMDQTLAMWGRLSRDGIVASRSIQEPEGLRIMTEFAMQPLAEDDRPKRKASCYVRDLELPDGQVERVVYQPETHEVVVLNSTASLIFDWCDGEHRVADMLDAMERRFAAEKSVLQRDLEATLDHFRQKGLLEVIG